MGAPRPIAYSEILAFSELTGEWLDRWEVTVIGRLDQAFLDEAFTKLKEDA